MILCFLHQPALRRRLNDGEPLSARAQSHLKVCARCREMVATHSRIVERLSTISMKSIPAPPFLHARVMNGLQEKSVSRVDGAGAMRRVIVTAGVAVAAICIALMASRQPQRQAVSWPEVPTQIIFKTALPANPLETEIQALRADTVNAARGLAATFLPAHSESADGN